MVQEVVYIGTDTRYAVGLPSGALVVARVQNLAGRGRGDHSVGDRVALGWSPEDARALTT